MNRYVDLGKAKLPAGFGIICIERMPSTLFYQILGYNHLPVSTNGMVDRVASQAPINSPVTVDISCPCIQVHTGLMSSIRSPALSGEYASSKLTKSSFIDGSQRLHSRSRVISIHGKEISSLVAIVIPNRNQLLATECIPATSNILAYFSRLSGSVLHHHICYSLMTLLCGYINWCQSITPFDIHLCSVLD